MSNNKPTYEDLQNLVLSLTMDNTSLKSQVQNLQQQNKELKENNNSENARRHKDEKFLLMFYPTLDVIENLAQKNHVAAIKILFHILRNAHKNGAYSESMASMANHCNIVSKTVTRSVKTLVEKEILAVGKLGNRNIYGVNPKYVMKTNIGKHQLTAYNYIKRANLITDKDEMADLMHAVIRMDTKAYNVKVGTVEED